MNYSTVKPRGLTMPPDAPTAAKNSLDNTDAAFLADPTSAKPAAAPPADDFKPWIDSGGPGRGDPAQSDPAKFVQTRDGLKDRKTGALVSGNPPGAPAAPAGDDVAPRDQPADGKTYQVGDLQITETDAKKIMAQIAENDLRKTQIPASPADYKIELPKDLKLPDGIQYQLDTSNPVLKDVAAWAHRSGLTNGQLSEVLGMYAMNEARQTAAYQAAATAERTKLGAMAATRVDAVTTWLRSHLGDDLAKPFLATLVTSKQVEGFERLMTKMSGQGVAGFTQQHREHSDQNKVDQATYDKMSYSARLEYAKQFSQPSDSNSRGR
jgi:hypothetical protein